LGIDAPEDVRVRSSVREASLRRHSLTRSTVAACGGILDGCGTGRELAGPDQGDGTSAQREVTVKGGRLVRWVSRIFLVLTLPAALAFGAVPSSSSGSGALIVEYPLPTSGSFPDWITGGPDGNLWFTEGGKKVIGRITPTGGVLEFPIPASSSSQGGITVGSDGNLWMVGGAYLEKITPTGSISAILLASYLADITAGSDGNLWLTEPGANKIARMTPSLSLTEFPLPTTNSTPTYITAGPDGNVWFTEYNAIGRITPTGGVTEFPYPPAVQPQYGVSALTAGFGHIWFTTVYSIWSVTPTGSFTEFPLPKSDNLFGITAGPDGNLWFTEWGSNVIGRMTPAGSISAFAVPTANSGPYGIAVGPDGNIWFTEPLANQIGKFVLSSVEPTSSRVFLPAVFNQ